MAKKLKKRMVWLSTMYSMPILVDIKGGKPERSGYVCHFETEQDAIEYKRKQLARIKKQYAILGEQLPAVYADQIKTMEMDYEN